MIDYLQANSTRVAEFFINHLSLSVTAVVISMLLWIPAGVLMARNRRVAEIMDAVSSILYCIPSIAMFAMLITIPFLGLGRTSAVIGLVLYAMLPVTRAVSTGIVNVDRSYIEASRGMGMTDRDIFWQVELPLAVPSIFSGFRIMSIMVVSTATLATYIGERNLGRLISQGLSRSNMQMILTGAVLVSVTALALDAVLAGVEKRLNRYRSE